MILALFMTGVGHMLLSGVSSYVMLLIVYMGVVSLSFHAGFMDAPMLIANTWFIRKRTMAMALISGSIGVGGVIFTPLLSAAVHAYGWRQAAFGCGIAFIVAGMPLALWCAVRRKVWGCCPTVICWSMPIAPLSGNPNRSKKSTLLLAQALRTSSFWFLTSATAIRVIILSAINVHYVALMVWKGVSEQRAAVFLAAQAFMAVPSHLLFGWIGDRLPTSRKLMATCMLFATISMFVLARVHAEWAILIFVALFSVVESTFPVNWSSVGEYFGRKNFAKIRGSMSFVSTWGSVRSVRSSPGRFMTGLRAMRS